MSSEALILVSIVWTTVALTTGFFFYKILTMPKKAESDSDDDEMIED